MASNIRIGIDVGGTFTHAVAIDGTTLDILGKTKVPTTHRAAQGVAKGIIESLLSLLKEAKISPDEVSFIAHSTTQATNALLEGDVAPVGILGLGNGANSLLARLATRVEKIQLAPGKYLTTYHRFLDVSKPPSNEAIQTKFQELIEVGAKAIVVSEAFAVDEPDNEMRCLEIARQLGLLATSSCEVSQLYGLKVRTRTAVINAAMLPKMIESANMTEASVREAGIKAPVMIMRSDGGVMDIDAMRKRPILTMLSGPAAGVAAAMMYLHISDGIFLEVGGTSTDISAIRNGRALVKSAQVGGHRVYMHTLDVRTVGIAGGSIPRLKDNQLIDVGPRSAHIAGLNYASFTESFSDPHLSLIQPQASDPSDYVAISLGQGPATFCLTPTCAANLLKLVPKGDCAIGNADSVKTAFQPLSNATRRSSEELAKEILTISTDKCSPVVSQLIKDYKLDPNTVTLVGGGGGAAALVPFLGQQMNMRFSLAQNADVISAIGVALALIRETIERQIVNPTNDDILRIRQDAYAAVHKMGADPSTIDIHVEIDSRSNTVRATASGATSLTGTKIIKRDLSPEERKAAVAESMRLDTSMISLAAETDNFQVYAAETMDKKLGGLLQSKCQSLRVLDSNGVIRLQIKNGAFSSANASQADSTIAQLSEEHAQYGDAGRILPSILLLAGPKIVDLSGLLDLAQVQSLAKVELQTIAADGKVIVIASMN